MRFKLFQTLILLLLVACTNKNNSGPDAVYAAYSISGEEGDENVTCVLKFFESRHSSRAVVLAPPAAVLLDGSALQADSAGRGGAYYEVQKPTAQFAGTHTIVFKNAEGKAYNETFSFQPFSLTTDLGEAVSRGDILLQVEGLQPGEPIRVLLTDTAFATPDINDIDTVQNGALLITRAALENVASGPVTLHLYKEEEWPLKNAPGSGGLLSITYSLSREFELTND